MKKLKYANEQVDFAVNQTDPGTRAQVACRKMGISQATLYNWKKEYDRLGRVVIRF